MSPYWVIRLYLGWHSIVSLLFGGMLIGLPRRLITGPATATIYGLAAPPAWGVGFVLLALLCLLGVARTVHAWRPAIVLLIAVQVCWGIGLFAPLVTTGRTNLLSCVPWFALSVTSILVAHYTQRRETSTA